MPQKLERDKNRKKLKEENSKIVEKLSITSFSVTINHHAPET